MSTLLNAKEQIYKKRTDVADPVPLCVDLLRERPKCVTEREAFVAGIF